MLWTASAASCGVISAGILSDSTPAIFSRSCLLGNYSDFQLGVAATTPYIGVQLSDQ